MKKTLNAVAWNAAEFIVTAVFLFCGLGGLLAVLFYWKATNNEGGFTGYVVAACIGELAWLLFVSKFVL